MQDSLNFIIYIVGVVDKRNTYKIIMTAKMENTLWSNLLYAFSHFVYRIPLFKRVTPHNLELRNITFHPHVSVSGSQDNCSFVFLNIVNRTILVQGTLDVFLKARADV